MKIENQVCTYEQALELKRLGVNAPAYFIWWVNNDGELKCEPYQSPGFTLQGAEKAETSAWAYNVAELGEALRQHNRGYRHYPDMQGDGRYETEAYMRAGTLIGRLQYRILEAVDVNKRINEAA